MFAALTIALMLATTGALIYLIKYLFGGSDNAL